MSKTWALGSVSGSLAASDVFVIPSRSEGYCLALVEAMSAGLPCVCTRVGIAPDVIRHGWNGLLVDRENCKELAEALLLLTRDPQLRENLAREAAASKVAPSLGEYAERLVDLYASLLPRRSELAEQPAGPFRQSGGQ